MSSHARTRLVRYLGFYSQQRPHTIPHVCAIAAELACFATVEAYPPQKEGDGLCKSR